MDYGYKGVLVMDGEDPIELDHCNYNFIRQVNESTGEVASGIMGGAIVATYLDYPKDSIWEWGMKYKLKNGSLKVKHGDQSNGSFISTEEVKITETACVDLQFDYSRHGSSHFFTKLILNSNQSVVGDTYDWVQKGWKNQPKETKNSKNEIKNTVEDILGLNDTSVDARLYLNGKEYSIDTFSTRFQQTIDSKGEPENEVRGGLLSIGFNQVTDEDLNYWMFHQQVFKSGAISFASFSRIANPVITIEFDEGRLVNYSKSIDPSLGLNIVITARKIKINGLEHTNNPGKVY